MPKQKRYPGIIAMSGGRKRIRLRAVDPRTGRLKEVDRIISGSIEEAVVLQQHWRRDIRTADRQSQTVPRLVDYATSWIQSKTVAVKPSTAENYATVLDVRAQARPAARRAATHRGRVFPRELIADRGGERTWFVMATRRLGDGQAIR